MKSADAFPGKYLRASDILGREISVVISHIQHEEVSDGEMKWVIYFEGKLKGLVLNKTNWETLEAAYDDSDNWPGKPAIMFTAKTQDRSGKTVDGIRFRVPKRPASISTAKVPTKPESENPAAFIADSIDDDIPF